MADQLKIRARHFFVSLVIVPIVILTTGSGWASQGLVVVSVAQNSEAATAGISPGDVLHSWYRGLTGKVIESPFDLMRIEVEQGPLGTVTIVGSRQSHKNTWKLGQEEWAIQVRPNFTTTNVTLYSRAKKFAERGNITEILPICRTIASSDSRQRWIYPWCLADIAQFATQTKRWRLTDTLYREALGRNAEPLVRLFLLRTWAISFEERGDWVTAARLMERSITQSESLDREGLLTASILSECALVNSWRRNLKTARAFYSRALMIQKKFALESLVTARTLIRLAAVSLNEGDGESAAKLLDEAKAILDKCSLDGPDMARFHGQSASLLIRRGELSQAKEHLIAAIDILQTRWPESLDLAGVLSSLAYVSGREGDLGNAEAQLRRAWQIYNQHPVNPVLGLYLSNTLATLAYDRRNWIQAERFGQRTEEIAAKLMPDSVEHAGSLMNLGMYAFQNGDVRASEAHWIRASRIIQKAAPGSFEHAKILGGISKVARELGDLKTAGASALNEKEILAHLAPEGVDMADAFEDLAAVARARGALRQAEGCIRQALAIREKLMPSSPDYADALAQCAQILQEEGQLDLASKEYEKFSKNIDSDMVRLGGSREARMGFRSYYDASYKGYIEILVQQGKTNDAFEIAERSRAQNLLEILTGSRVDFVAHMDHSSKAEEQSLRSAFASESDRRLRLLSGPHSTEQVNACDTKLADIVQKFAELESRIRESSPRYAELTQAKVASVRDVQKYLLDSDTLLLEYSLGKRQSYVWLISSESAHVFRLPGGAQIDKEAGLAYREITEANSPKNDEGGHRRLGVVHTSSLEYLSRIVLGPVEPALSNKRLLVVADGSLHYIPFAALPVKDPSTGLTTSLVARHEIINLPSASVLLALRKEHRNRQSPLKAVAVLADPVFEASDPRVKNLQDLDLKPARRASTLTGESVEAIRSIDLTRERWARAMGVNSKLVHFARLVYSRQEAEEIIRATPSGDSLSALDFDASRTTAMNPKLSQYKIVHFATHGLIDTQHPELSGLLLSMVDKSGRAQIGLLSLSDVYGLNLPVEMVVLSGCETALGKEAKGEGLIGLTRGFMYAGASRVLASLWKVNDSATSSLMGRFYRALEHDHLSAAAALRKAQLEMRSDRRWSAPYYWAGFQLQGEWK